jgi:Ser/Thr protein kinase RdoA (MazF antagonist)
VPAPGPVRSLDGPVLARIGGALVRVATWVDVEDARTDLDPRALGALLAVLHRDPLPAHGPVDPWYTDGVPPHTWEEVAQALAGARAPFAAEFAASVPGFLDLQEAFRPPETVQLCHRDLWANNLRATPDGGLCVLDWDNCGPAGATQELAVVLVEFCAGDAERVGALCRAYLAAGGRGLPAEPGDLTMVLAQFGHFALTAGRRWLAAGDDDARARAEAWFREGYEHPLDRRGVEELLSAVRAAVRAAGRPA